MTNSARSYAGFRNGNFGEFCTPGLSFADTLNVRKVIDDESHTHRDFLYPLLDLRRSRLLAHFGYVFLRVVLLDYEEANTVSPNTVDIPCDLIPDVLSPGTWSSTNMFPSTLGGRRATYDRQYHYLSLFWSRVVVCIEVVQ